MRTAKYGATNRKLVKKVQEQKRKRYECPKCNKVKVRRKSYAQWECRSCGALFAGAAYTLSSKAGETIKRLIYEKEG